MAAAVKFTIAAVVLSIFAGSGGRRAAAEADARAAAAVPAISERLPFAFSNVAAAEDGEEEGGSLVDCWGAVDEVRSQCAEEAAVFFLDGEAYLGRACCLAVRAVARRCGWPLYALGAAVGFTADEAGVLRGFCGGGGDASLPAAHPRP